MVLVQKWPFFQLFFFRQYRPRKCLLWYSRTKKRPSRLLKQEVQKLQNSHFLQGVNPWFWSKNGHFYNLYFLGNIIQENVFYDILERKNAFLGYRKRSSKSRKIDIFFDIFPWFWSKNGHFSNFLFLGNVAQEMSFMIF